MANALILGLSYPSGIAAPSITDNQGNTWPAATVTADGGNTFVAIYVLMNPAVGSTTITVNFAVGTSVIPFEYTLSEFTNVGAVDVSSGTGNVFGTGGTSSVNAGSMTTTVDGDLIWTYVSVNSGNSLATPSSFTPGSGFALLDADVSWVSATGCPHASQFQIQSTHGAINPGIIPNGDNGAAQDPWNCAAVAVKASGGTPRLIQHVASSTNVLGVNAVGNNFSIPLPNNVGAVAVPQTIYVNKVIHQTGAAPANAVWKLQFPSVGNLRCIIAGTPSGNFNVTNVQDSEGNVWTIRTGNGSSPQAFYMPNVGPNTNLTVSLTISGTPAGVTLRYYDISNADHDPFDGDASVNQTGITSVSNCPSIIPTVPGDLVIAGMAIGTGPGITVTGVPGAIWDLCTYIGNITGTIAGTVLTVLTQSAGTLYVGAGVAGANIPAGNVIISFGTGTGGTGTYNLNAAATVSTSEAMTTGELDTDAMENADGAAHLYNAGTAQINWGWTFSNEGSQSIGGYAIAFRTAGAAIETNRFSPPLRTYPPQWTRNKSLLLNTAQDFSSSALETNPHWQGRSYPPQWSETRKLWQTDPQDFSSSAVETNPHWIGKPWPAQWVRNQTISFNTAQDFSSSAIETNTLWIGLPWGTMWKVNISLRMNAAQDLSSAAVETNVNFVLGSWRPQWIVQKSLMRGTAQDFSSTSPVVTGFHILTPMGAKLISPIGI